MAGRTALAGVLVPAGLALLSIPTSLFGGDKPNTTAQALVFVVELAVVAAIAVPVLARQWVRTRHDFAPSWFVRVFGPLYLGVLGVLWISSLGAYVSANNGVTADGTPTGSLVYTWSASSWRCWRWRRTASPRIAPTSCAPRERW